MATRTQDLDHARQTVDWFVGQSEPQHEAAYRLLAQYGAMPLLLTPELLNYLRNRFLRGRVPWVAEIDLLLSELCRPVDYELYVMQPAVRAYLLAEFKRTTPPGELARVARILIHYVRHLARANAFLDDRMLQAQQWAAMVYLDEQRGQAAREIAASFANATAAGAAGIPAPDYVDRAELQRLTRLTETLAPELGQHQALVDYAALVSELLAGLPTQSPAAQRAFRAEVEGVTLAVPEALIAESVADGVAAGSASAAEADASTPTDPYLTVTLRVDLRGEALDVALETPEQRFADTLAIDLQELDDVRTGLAMERTPEIMQRLSDGLFSGPPGELLQTMQHQAKAEGRGLRLAIRSEQTGDAPWEMLYADGFLATAERGSVVRHHPAISVRPTTAQPGPLGVLVVDANEGGPITKMSVAPNMRGRQRREIEEALAPLVEEGLITLDVVDALALTEPETLAAQAERWSVLHYLGAPPNLDDEADPGLALRDLAMLLDVLGAGALRLVLLEAVTPGAVYDRDVAELLARFELPALIRFRSALLNEFRTIFVGGFYHGLARGQTLEEAMTETRRELFFENPKRDSWSLPVLHLAGLPGPALVGQEEVMAAQDGGQQSPATSPIDFEWITIPEGEFLMGSDKEQDTMAQDDETPQHTVYLPEYRIARYPVTNRQYKQFVDATGHEAPQHWENGQIPDGKDDHPVVYVSWHDAQAFCEWAGVQLPSEAQWEKAARSTDGRTYPWGEEQPTKELCNFNQNEGGTTPVGKYSPQGDSHYGLADVAGNVWEWTSSLYKSYPYDPGDGREDPKADGRRTLRGGSWYNGEDSVRCAARSLGDPVDRSGDYGFRVVSPGAVGR